MYKLGRPAGSKGFTLIELIVVIAILGIMAAVALPRYMSLQRDARIAKLNAARGSVAAASALVHATVLAKNGISDPTACAVGGTANNDSGATGTVCSESGLIATVWGYPASNIGLGAVVPGIVGAAGLTSVFSPDAAALQAEGYQVTTAATAIFQVAGAPTPGSCQFTYAEPLGQNTAPVISAVTTTGC